MKQVNVSTLKNQLSRYLKFVKKGEEIVVMDRRQPVAKLVKIEDLRSDLKGMDYLRKLEEDGIISIGKNALPSDFFHTKIKAKKSVLEALLEERDEGL